MNWLFLFFGLLGLGAATWFYLKQRQAKEELERALRQLDAKSQRLERLQQEMITERSAWLNSMTDGVLVLDAWGKIVFANQAVEQLFELGENPRGKTLLETFRRHELAGFLQELVREKKPKNYTLELQGPPRRSFRVAASALALSEISDPPGERFLMVFHDVTPFRELEVARREFVANVSHELRTPLSLIKGSVETLMQGPQEDPAVTQRFMQMIHRHTDRVIFLVEDLLTLSQFESTQAVLNLHPHRICEVAERVCEDLRSLASDRQVEIRNDIPAELVATIDAERMEQVFCNLVENAIKYSHPQGRVQLGGRELDGRVEITVTDDGPGIPAESLSRLFEPFYRVDRARARATGGTGLGLAIAKHIVSAHGGEVWVRSIEGQGSTFGFSLPVQNS